MKFAKNFQTEEIVFVSKAVKGDKYVCSCCNEDVIFKECKVITKHYSHKPDSQCTKVGKLGKKGGGGESIEHAEAKDLMRDFIKDVGIDIEIHCEKCNSLTETVRIPKNKNVKCEYAIKNPETDERGIADIAVLDYDGSGNDAVIEIWHKHRTEESRRYGVWFELDASGVLSKHIQHEIKPTNKLVMVCRRQGREWCSECKRKQELKLQREKEMEANGEANEDYSGCSRLKSNNNITIKQETTIEVEPILIPIAVNVKPYTSPFTPLPLNNSDDEEDENEEEDNGPPTCKGRCGKSLFGKALQYGICWDCKQLLCYGKCYRCDKNLYYKNKNDKRKYGACFKCKFNR